MNNNQIRFIGARNLNFLIVSGRDRQVRFCICVAMERLLEASKELSDKVDSNESATTELLRQTESLQQELKSMRQVHTYIATSKRLCYTLSPHSTVSRWR